MKQQKGGDLMSSDYLIMLSDIDTLSAKNFERSKEI